MASQEVFPSFTCITCRVAFVEADAQRAHYKTDWHRYNLKRKVADMPPVTAENFAERVLAQRTQAEQSTQQDKSAFCSTCNKSFSSNRQFENHVQSRKHKDAEARENKKSTVDKLNQQNKAKSSAASQSSAVCAEDKDSKNLMLKEKLDEEAAGGMEVETDSDDESCEEWSGDALGLEECLFCSFLSHSLQNNLDHMRRKHSFFIPDIEYLTDLEGLISYLDEKVGEEHVCLWCNDRSKAFRSVRAVQQHMLDKGHCMMHFEGDTALEYSDFYDYRSSYPDYNPDQPAEGEEEESDEDELEEPGYELVLPSGATVGHRSLHRYYRQNLKPDRKPHSTALTHALAQYKALGWTGTTGVSAKKCASDIRAVQRAQKRHFMAQGVKNNKMQMFYRSQTGFD